MNNIQSDYSKQINYSFQTSNTNPNQFQNQNNENIIDEQKVLTEKIKNLQRKLKAYQIMTVDQNKKLTEFDNLIIEYNSLNKNDTELENELNILKMQNSQLMDALNCKNCLLDDYQKMIEISTEKFKMLNEHHSNLQNQNKENEGKLRSAPNIKKDKDQLNDQLNKYEGKISNLKDEFEKKEELQKMKLKNLEKSHKNQLKQYENELNENNLEMNKLKTDLETLKKRYDDLNDRYNNQDDEKKKLLQGKEKEKDKLNKTILQLQKQYDDIKSNSQNELLNSKKMIEQLQDELRK